ncbi:MAG: hypothetical protein WCH01_23240 [Methylococcaceae bacterium]
MSRAESPIENLAAAIHMACLVDLPEIKYRDRDWGKHRAKMNAMTRDEKAAFYQREKEPDYVDEFGIDRIRRHAVRDVDVVAMFPQTWGSTALGFGGIGGSAMTTAYTIVIYSQHAHCLAIYFGGRFAYLVDGGSKQFVTDMQEHSLASVKDSAKYKGA